MFWQVIPEAGLIGMEWRMIFEMNLMDLQYLEDSFSRYLNAQHVVDPWRPWPRPPRDTLGVSEQWLRDTPVV